MDFKLKNMSNYRNYGSMEFGVIPYAIYDIEKKVLYLPELDWFHELSNSDYQRWINDFIGDNVEGRYNVLLMNNIKWKKVLAMTLGTYKLNPLKFDNGKFDVDSYIGYFITEED